MDKKIKNKGYVLLVVLVFSIIIALIGAGLALMSKQSFLSTRANILFNKVQKAAHYGIMEGLKRIITAGGICEEGNIENILNVEGAEVRLTTSRRGLVCFLRSEATYGNAKAVIVASTQGFYGIGTYTVKGNVSANVGGGLISGCDTINNCNIPGFMLSGTLTTSAPTRTCTNPGSYGIYGVPPYRDKVKFYDLVPLVFNVNCFYELLNVLENESQGTGYPMGLGSNPFWNAKKDIEFDKGGLNACPDPRKTDEAGLIMGKLTINFPSLPNDIPGFCQVSKNKNLTLNLSTMGLAVEGEGSIDLSNCTKVLLNTSKSININGKAKEIKFIYTQNNNGITISGAENGILINLNTTKVSINSNFYPFVVYSKGPITLNNVDYIRAISKENINISHPHLTYSTLITEKDVVNLVNDMNLENVNIFAKRLNFGSNKNSVNISGGLLYLYTLADKNRDNNTVLYNGCNWGANPGNCAWYGYNIPTINIGTVDNPVLIILVNSATYLGDPNRVNINTLLFGEGVTYLTWKGDNYTQNYEGILVRNFPSTETLNINITSGFILKFNYAIINKLNQNYWIVRRFECIKDDPLPQAQVIQTLHTSY